MNWVRRMTLALRIAALLRDQTKNLARSKMSPQTASEAGTALEMSTRQLEHLADLLPCGAVDVRAAAVTNHLVCEFGLDRDKTALHRGFPFLVQLVSADLQTRQDVFLSFYFLLALFSRQTA